MRSISILLIVAVSAVALIGCGDDAPAPTGYAPDQTSEAYAYVHGGYVGLATVSTLEDGSLDISLDEMFLPHTLCEVDMEADEWSEDNTVFYIQRGDEVRVAKYISYAGTNYVGSTVGTALAYVEADEEGNPSGNTILEKAIIRNQGTMASYWQNVLDGELAIYTEFGGSAMPITESPYGGLTKSDSEYWNFGIGWSGNMEALIEAAEAEGVGFKLDEITRGDDNTWSLADATTSATMSDFQDYFNLVQTAVGRLSMQ